MNDFDWGKVQRNKDKFRSKAAALPFEEKLRILERMRERSESLRGAWHPINSRRLEPSSDIRIVVYSTDGRPEDNEQSVHGTIQVKFFGANATLTTAATPAARTSTDATTTSSSTHSSLATINSTARKTGL